MEFETEREPLLKALQTVIGVVERRHTLPILGNVLIDVHHQQLSVTATDLEVEIKATTQASVKESGQITLPARKFMDIIRNLPEPSRIHARLDQARMVLKIPHSRFTLTTLPGTEFPLVEENDEPQRLELAQSLLRWLIDRTSFAMGLQDVRYYLNGLLLELEPHRLRAVATDGHRLALAEVPAETSLAEPKNVIVPRKGVQELLRLLHDAQDPLELQLRENHLRVTWPNACFTTKLIDGDYPNYRRVIPKQEHGRLEVEREALRLALVRASILADERLNGVRFILSSEGLRICSNNPEQEEAQEDLAGVYVGDPVEIGFSARYLLDALTAIEESTVEIVVSGSNSSAILYGRGNDSCRYVVMPLFL
ncbi:MAG: DNA polymerase III subunit beta [Nitrococcus sp.]|nr:DNA polymerase III subunit beta [Nitrococcus sp.]